MEADELEIKRGENITSQGAGPILVGGSTPVPRLKILYTLRLRTARNLNLGFLRHGEQTSSKSSVGRSQKIFVGCGDNGR